MFMGRQPFHALAHGGGLQEVQGRRQLGAGVGAVQVQRAVKAQIHRLVDKVDAVMTQLRTESQEGPGQIR